MTLTKEEHQIILDNIKLYFDGDVKDPHQELADLLGCDRDTAKTKYFSFLFTPKMGFAHKFLVRLPFHEATYMSRELAKLTGKTHKEIYNEAGDFADSKLKAYTERNSQCTQS